MVRGPLHPHGLPNVRTNAVIVQEKVRGGQEAIMGPEDDVEVKRQLIGENTKFAYFRDCL